MMHFNSKSTYWIFEPKKYKVSDDEIVMQTEPDTDLWQRTCYGFSNDNAPALLMKTDKESFSFTVKTKFNTNTKYDQCGVIIYQNSDNWFKASIEFENEQFQRLGSVVTNNGFSDWATTDIDVSIKAMHYRLSRKKSDFCIENSYDGMDFKQMRIFHLFEGAENINFGLYACSPGNSSFKAVFSKIQISECLWKTH